MSASVLSKVTDDLYVNAFIGVGYINATDNNFIDSNKDGNKIIESALSLTYEYSNNISFSGQIAYREFGEHFTDKSPRIDYANVNYTSSLLSGSEQSLSIGRVKAPIGIYNLSRDIPTTRPSIIMPQSAYLDLFRNIMISTDGILASTSHQALNGFIDFTLSYGKLNIDNNFSSVALGENMNGDWDAGAVVLADIRYSSPDLIVGVSYNSVSPEYISSPTDALPVFPVGNSFSNIIDGKIEVNSYSAFLQYNINKLELSTEYTYREVIASGLTPTPDDHRPMEGYYAQLRYAASNSLNLTLRYDQLYRKADYKDGFITPYGTEPAWYNNASTSSFSINYIFDENWTVIADMHYVEGSAWLPPFSYQVPESVEQKDWVLSAVEIIYSF
jgi:hypothetical protein